MPSGHLLFLVAVVFYSSQALSVDRVSITSGNWNSAGTWSPFGTPGAADNIVIAAGHVVTMNGNPGNCLSLTLNGTADWTTTRTTNVGLGGLTINNGGTINDASSTGRLNVTGGFTIPAGATATISRITLTVAGTTSITGTLLFVNTGGIKTFNGDIVINNGGTWSATVAENFRINASVTNGGTFLANTGTYTLGGASKTLGGSRNLIFNIMSVSGSYTNTDSLQVSTNLGGAGTITQAANSYFVVGDLSPNNIITASASGNTIRYLVSGNMSTLDITYHNVIIEELGGTVNGLGTYTVNGNYDVMSGTVSMGDVTIGGNLSVAASSTLAIGAVSPSVTGSTTVSGSVNITSATGTKTFGDLSVLAGGTWNSTVAEGFRINGNLANTGTFTANTGTYQLAGAGKTISGTISVPTLSVTGTYTNNGSLTSTTTLAGAGAISQGAAGTLNLSGATFSVITFNASTSGNTVNYSLAGAQNVRIPSDGSYHHLGVAGTGIKTLLGVADINGNLTISSTLNANNFNITLGGNWSSTGTFTPGANTVTLDGAAQAIIRTGGETYNHLAVSGTSIKTLGSDITTNGNLNINSTLDISASNFAVNVKGNWDNNGTFTRRNGTVTFNGTLAQTVGGTVTTDFADITQSNAAGVSLTRDQNLFGALTVSSGTFTTTGFNFTLKSDASGTARVATIPGGANFTGNLIMERYTGSGPTDWRFLASCVSGATLAQWADDFATSGFAGSTDPPNSFVSIYSYDETQLGDLDTFGFVPATNVTNPISAGVGYWVYLGPTPVTFEVTGAPYKFSQSPTVTFSSSGDITDDGWNLIANPYPSAIDWDNGSWTKASLDDAVYIYNSFTGSYATYVAGIGVNGGSQYIPSSQAFWVKANAAVPSITAVEAVKATPNPTFMKQMSTPNTSNHPMAFMDFPIPLNTNTTPNSIKLTGSNSAGGEEETFICFKTAATSGFDPNHDAWKIANLNITLPNISSIINDTSDLAINSLPSLTSDVDIKIRFTVSVSGTYSIRRDSMLMLPMSSCVVLEDLANGNLADLRSNISYSFFISDTTTLPRFILHISEPLSKTAVNTGCAGDSTGMAIVAGAGTGPWNFVWKDSSGNVLQTTINSTTADTLMNLPAGIFTIEASGSACGTVTDTIEIKSASTLSVMTNYSDVSCFGMNDGSAYASVAGGFSPITYAWSTGATTSAINNLSAGNYSVTVTDGTGCAQTQYVIVSQPVLLAAGFTTSTDTVNLSINNSAAFTNTSSGAASCSWDFGDGSPSDTVQNPIHYYSAGGNFITTQIISSGGCSDSAFKTIVVIDPDTTSINEDEYLSSMVIVIYDHNDIYIAFDLDIKQDVRISVYNSIGENTSSHEIKNVKNDKVKLPGRNLSPGVYMMVATMENSAVSRKFILPSR